MNKKPKKKLKRIKTETLTTNEFIKLVIQSVDRDKEPKTITLGLSKSETYTF